MATRKRVADDNSVPPIAGEGADSTAGRAKGGRARAEALSAEERRVIAKTAALARWHGDVPKATHEGTLTIGDLTLPCAVLEGGRRVLSERGVMRAFGVHRGGSLVKAALLDEEGGARLPMFLAARNLRPFIDNELALVLTQPIIYRNLAGGGVSHGLDASLIPKVCEVWLRARDGDALLPSQQASAARAYALIRGLAHTGIIALVDEATGYQEVRDRFALQAILDKFLRAEFAAWAKAFPDAFYEEMFRLKKWTWPRIGARRPGVVAHYTNEIVYRRLAPGILDELRIRNPMLETGRRRAKHHQWLTGNIGNPRLAEHLYGVIGLMRAHDTWEGFMKALERAYPPKDVAQYDIFHGELT